MKLATLFKKGTLAQVFSCEFCKISKNIFFPEHLWATASVIIKECVYNWIKSDHTNHTTVSWPPSNLKIVKSCKKNLKCKSRFYDNCPQEKLFPSSKTNPNPNPNPNQGAILLGAIFICPDTVKVVRQQYLTSIF